MKIRRGVVIGIVVLAVVGASFAAVLARAEGVATSWIAVLSGDNEVPVRETRARGVAIFHLSEDGESIEYKLIVANIENVIASHIHIGAVGANGPVVIFLYGNVPAGGGRIQGVIAQGTLTAAGLVGPLSGHPLSDLIDAMNSGNAYVNAHTNDGVGGVNTGPGDFPGGEVRGQVVVAD